MPGAGLEPARIASHAPRARAPSKLRQPGKCMGPRYRRRTGATTLEASHAGRYINLGRDPQTGFEPVLPPWRGGSLPLTYKGLGCPARLALAPSGPQTEVLLLHQGHAAVEAGIEPASLAATCFRDRTFTSSGSPPWR